MSQENAEAVRRVLEDEINPGNFGAAFDALFDPRVAFRDELGTLDNRDDLRSYVPGYQESFEGFRIDIRDARVVGGTIVLVINQAARSRRAASRSSSRPPGS